MLAGLIHLGACRGTAAWRIRKSNRLPELLGQTVDRISDSAAAVLLALALWPLSLAVLLGQGVRTIDPFLQKARP